jgi:hypothetical protein
MSPAKLTPAQVRDRRTKIAAVVLSVVLLAALALQGPKLLKMIHKSSPPVSPSAVNVAPIGGTTTTSPTPVALGVANAATTTVSSQLTSFTRFALKNPFYAQNVTTTTSTPASTSPAASTTTAAKTTPATTTTTPSKSTPAATTPKAPSTTTTAPAASVPFTVSPAAPPNAAILLTNGKREIIPIGEDFPSEAPLFELNSVATHGKKQSIRISVLGGAFTDGVRTVPIEMGKTITFDNQSDGTRYVVKVLRLTTVAASPGSTTPAATTPAASTSSSKG